MSMNDLSDLPCREESTWTRMQLETAKQRRQNGLTDSYLYATLRLLLAPAEDSGAGEGT
jgi:hypothetical protein